MNSPEILNDPTIQMVVALEQHKDKMVAGIAEQLMSVKTWGNMNEKERKICVRHIVLQASSEEVLRKLLTEELGMGCCSINWYLPPDGDKTGLEAQMLVKALGGLISKNGAMVQIMTMDGMF
jgi:hypothetical protein